MIQNVIFNILYQVLNIIIPLITAPYISRVMTPSEIGIYSYSNSLCGIVATLMLLGIANYGSRTIAMVAPNNKRERAKTFWELFSMQVLSSLVGILVYAVMLFFSTGKVRVSLFAQAFYLLSVILDISWYFTGTGKIKNTVARSSIVKVVQTIAIFCFVKSPDDLILYILIMSVGTLVGNLALWAMAQREIPYEKISFANVVSHVKPNLVLFIPLLASSVFVYMDKIMLGAIASSADLGVFEYAEKIVRIPLTMISAIGAVMMPHISGLLAQQEHATCQRYFGISMRYISLLASAMFFGFLAVGPELADVYLGKGFSECGRLIQVMSAIIIFSSFANIIRTQWLIPQKKDKKYAEAIISGAVINLLLNILLIPSMGSVGAAIGTIGAEAMVFLYHLSAMRKEQALLPLFLPWVRSLLGGCMIFAAAEMATTLCTNSIYKLCMGVIAGVLVFAVLLFLQIRKDGYRLVLRGNK